jgi:hypothetical protein
MLEINRIYWEYDNGDWWRPSPYKDAFVNVPRYKNYGPTIRHDLFTLVEKFAERYRKYNFYIALSGGIDSEITAETFYQLGIPFEAVTLRLFNGRNDYDLLYVEEFCKNRSIKSTIIDLDLKTFKDEVIPKATRYGQFTHSLSQIALTYLFETMNDKDILIYSGHNPDICKFGVGWWEDSPNMVKYAINTDKNFFTFTSLEPIFMHYLLNYDPNQPGDKDNSFIYKCYPNLKRRTKRTGWEVLGDVVSECEPLLVRPTRPDDIKQIINKRVRYLAEDWPVFLTWK